MKPLRSWRNFLPLAALALTSPVSLASAAGLPTPAPKPATTSAPLQEATRSSYRAAEPDEAARAIEEAVDLIEQEYVDGSVTRAELVEAAMRGIVEHLNRRAQRDGQPAVNSLLSRRDVARLSDSMSGQQSGIGVLARPGEHGLDVLQVFNDSPASKAGIKAGDHIRAVNDRTVSASADLFNLLRGDDGSTVRLSVVRDSAATGESPATLDVKIVRGRYRVSPVVSHVLENDLGYVRIAAFMRGTADDVAGDLLAFRESGVWGVVLDLRGNSGGSLEEAMKIASMFFDTGEPLLQIVGRSGEAQLVESEGERFWSGPVTVLVDGNTASAAEALASALQTHERGLLVGERTAGKGLGESIFGLPGGGALKLATARYTSAAGRAWAGRGLTPDSAVTSVILEPGEPLDPALRAALNIMARFHPERAPAINAAQSTSPASATK